jgi:invasion protein IalB
MRIFIITAILVVLCLGGLYIYKSGSSEAAPSAVEETQTAESGANDSEKPVEKGKDGAGWSKRCVEEDKSKCEVFITVTDSKTKQRFMEIAFGYPEPGQEVMAGVILPLGIVVSAGGFFQVDEDPQGKKFQIITCTPSGCIAKFKLDNAFMDKLTAGKMLTVGVMQTNGKPLKVQMPLENFANVHSEVKR